MCISTQFFKGRKAVTCESSYFTSSNKCFAAHLMVASEPAGGPGGQRAGRPSWGAAVGGRGARGREHRLRGRCEARARAATSFLSRSSFLAHVQPIIRKILQGERLLPAQMTSRGLGRSLPRCDIRLPGNAAGGSAFTWPESSI